MKLAFMYIIYWTSLGHIQLRVFNIMCNKTFSSSFQPVTDNFCGVSNDQLCEPLNRTGEKYSRFVAHIIKNYYKNLPLVFPENWKYSRNHGLFWGCNEKMHISEKVILVKQFIWNSFHRRNYVFSIDVLSGIDDNSEKIDCSSVVTSKWP